MPFYPVICVKCSVMQLSFFGLFFVGIKIIIFESEIINQLSCASLMCEEKVVIKYLLVTCLKGCRLNMWP